MQINQNCYRKDMTFEGDWTEEEMNNATRTAYASINQPLPGSHIQKQSQVHKMNQPTYQLQGEQNSTQSFCKSGNLILDEQIKSGAEEYINTKSLPIKQHKSFYTIIKQFFCRHNYELVDDETFQSPTNGEWINYIRLHKCPKCSKEEMIGSGWM